LDLYGCSLITDEGLRHLGSATTLDLSNCYKITDEGLRHLGSVTTLNLTDCSRITDEGLRHLGRAHSDPDGLRQDHGRRTGVPHGEGGTSDLAHPRPTSISARPRSL
jgi:hypothetical protein